MHHEPCATHHTLLTFDPKPGQWRDSGYSIHRPLRVVHPKARSGWCVLFLHALFWNTTAHAQWCHAGGDVSLCTCLSWDLLYILSGSHSVDLHCSVSESGDIEIQATHVSDHYFVWVYLVFEVLRTSRLLLVLEGTINVIQHSNVSYPSNILLL